MKQFSRRVFGNLSLGLLALGLSAGVLKADDSSPVYELRTYQTNPGKLPNLLKRFGDHTLTLFEKHGIKNLGYWVPVQEQDGSENTLIYVLEHKSREAAKASWKSFIADPEWQAVAKASQVDGKILASAPQSVFMEKTDYSPEYPLVQKNPERTFELRIYKCPEGKLEKLHQRFKNHTLRLFARQGMEHICYWTPTNEKDGKSDTLIYILAHPSHEAGLKAFDAFRKDPEWIAVKTESEKDGSLTVPQPEGVKSIYMKPASFSQLK